MCEGTPVQLTEGGCFDFATKWIAEWPVCVKEQYTSSRLFRSTSIQYRPNENSTRSGSGNMVSVWFGAGWDTNILYPKKSVRLAGRVLTDKWRQDRNGVSFYS